MAKSVEKIENIEVNKSNHIDISQNIIKKSEENIEDQPGYIAN